MIFELLFTGRSDQITPEMMGKPIERNTSIANYVWLPLRFDGDKVYIDWLDEWRIEDYK